MRWLSKLFGPKLARSEPDTAPETRHPPNPFAISDSASPPEMYERPAPPKRRGRSQLQREQDDANYVARLRHTAAVTASFNRTRAVSIGCVRYVWRTAEDEGTCAQCAKNNGKRFRYDTPPAGGHPGEGYGCPDKNCRCYAEPIVPVIGSDRRKAR